MKREYLYDRDKRDLDIEFYSGYDEAFLMRKAASLMLLADHPEAFAKFVKDACGNEDFVDDKFAEALRAEVHLTEFHQFETFFAIMLAPFQTLPDWIYLTTYRTEEIKEKVEAFLSRDIKKVTNGLLENKKDFIRLTLYDRYLESKIELWEESLDNVEWIINRIAYKYSKGDEYNAYKHGLRVMTGETFFRIQTEEPTPQILHNAHSKDSLRFLKCKDEGKENGVKYESVRQAFVHFNPQESINHLDFMCRMLSNIKKVRLGAMRGEPVELVRALSLDKDKAMSQSVIDKWEVSI